VSHETIYRSLFVQARRAQERAAELSPIEALERRSKPVDPNGDRRGYMKDAVSNPSATGSG
jgi:hypothetical protein